MQGADVYRCADQHQQRQQPPIRAAKRSKLRSLLTLELASGRAQIGEAVRASSAGRGRLAGRTA
jgi:hypothetical protein